MTIKSCIDGLIDVLIVGVFTIGLLLILFVVAMSAWDTISEMWKGT